MQDENNSENDETDSNYSEETEDDESKVEFFYNLISKLQNKSTKSLNFLDSCQQENCGTKLERNERLCCEECWLIGCSIHFDELK